MTPLLLAMIGFSLAMSISPGPVNMIVLSSAVNYGAKRTLSYVSGATLGFSCLLLFIGLGAYQFIKAYPNFLTSLAVAGSLYIIYLGYKIATIKANMAVNKADAPKFHHGFLLQWVNPKAWLGCVCGAAIFSNAHSNRQFLIFCAIYFIVCYLSLAIWAILGEKLSLLLSSNIRLRLFNIAMGLLLIISAAYLLQNQLT